MANIPQKNGAPVTTRDVSWSAMVIAEWGDEWRKPDIAYEMPGGNKKESTDQFQTGIYRKN